MWQKKNDQFCLGLFMAVIFIDSKVTVIVKAVRFTNKTEMNPFCRDFIQCRLVKLHLLMAAQSSSLISQYMQAPWHKATCTVSHHHLLAIYNIRVIFGRNFHWRKNQCDSASYELNSLNTIQECKETRLTAIQLFMQHLKLFPLTVQFHNDNDLCH